MNATEPLALAEPPCLPLGVLPGTGVGHDAKPNRRDDERVIQVTTVGISLDRTAALPACRHAAEVGLECHRTRCYDPHAGRWVSDEPIGLEAGDANFYRYVR